jgi:hypothetical protein
MAVAIGAYGITAVEGECSETRLQVVSVLLRQCALLTNCLAHHQRGSNTASGGEVLRRSLGVQRSQLEAEYWMGQPKRCTPRRTR